MNIVALIGRITKEPELKRLSEGRMQSSFVLAVNRNFKNQKGDIETDFVLCTIWGKLAENTTKYCGKGSLIGVNGRIQSRTYDRENGERVYVTEVIGEEVRFLATKPREEEKAKAASNQTPPSSVEDDFHLPERETEVVQV